MSARVRRLIAAHTTIALAAMSCATLLACLHDIAGETAVTVILGAAGIGGSGAYAAATADRPPLAAMVRTAARASAQAGE